MKVIIDDVEYLPKPPTCDHTELLDLRFQCDDLGREVSVREYLYALLETLWIEEEGFSGKRPFGNSGWQHDLYLPLIKAGAITGTLDSEDCINDYDRAEGDGLVRRLILEMCLGK